MIPDLYLGFCLGLFIAIPLAWLMHILHDNWRAEKMMRPVRAIVEPNIIPADGFKLHQVGARQKKPRPRKSNVTSLRDPPKAA